MDVQLIVLILNKPIPYGSAYIIYGSAMDVQVKSADFG